MDITINNNKRTVATATTLTQLLQQMKLDITRIAVEYNGDILSREQITAITLNQGDQLEIVSFVGGG